MRDVFPAILGPSPIEKGPILVGCSLKESLKPKRVDGFLKMNNLSKKKS